MIWKNCWYRHKRGICTIISGLADIPRLLQLSQGFSANITSPIFNVQKRIFSLWHDDFPTWLYLLRTPVYLMTLWCAYMKLRSISNFHFKMLYLVNICVYYSFRDDFEWYGKMADIAKNALYVPSFRVCWHSKIDAVITLFQCKYHLHNTHCAKPHFQPLKRRFCQLDRTKCARQCTWCQFYAHIWNCAELQIFSYKGII